MTSHPAPVARPLEEAKPTRRTLIQAQARRHYEHVCSLHEMIRTLEERLQAERAEAAALREQLAKAQADLQAAVIEVGEQVRARGEAEGKLRASEMAGIVDGWIGRATAAEQERDTAREECARLREENRILRDALKPFAQFGDRFTPNTALTWSGVAHTERVFKRFNHSDFRAARSALKTGGVDA